jgi:hypothetical protein
LNSRKSSPKAAAVGRLASALSCYNISLRLQTTTDAIALQVLLFPAAVVFVNPEGRVN